MYNCKRCSSKLVSYCYPYTKNIKSKRIPKTYKYIKCGHCGQWHEEDLTYTVEKCDTDINNDNLE